MVGNAGDESPQEPRITSYDLEPGIVLSLRLTMVFTVLATGYLVLDLMLRPRGPFSIAYGIVILALLAVVIWLYTRIAIGFVVTDSGLLLTSLLGWKERIQWREVRLLRGKSNRAVLVSEDHPIFYLYLFPARAMMSMAAMLREASNARVIGFGEKI